jgi:hypothetical protein
MRNDPFFSSAWVGNAAASRLLGRPVPVHPHVGGECYSASASVTAVTGSSPRGWGMPVPRIN